ncbi:MAG TPA: TlpA disulfide reductase family protein [Candidatus Acidoferrales bacterium]|nr:TlpA disulfide reductase family protein [Candidatus Acidoferrales bacterium]
MTRISRFVLIAFALLAIIAAGACRNSQPAQIGSEAPDFTLTNNGHTVSLSQLRGKPVVLVFWATWCPPCIEETPALVAMQKQLGDKVTVFAVSADVDDAAYQKFVARNMPGVLTARDGQNHSNGLYGTYAFPESFIIDRQGIIRRKLIGAVDWTSPEVLDYLSKM